MFVDKIIQVDLKVQEQLKTSQMKYKLRHDNHCVDHKFQVGDHVQLHLSQEQLEGSSKKLKPIRYESFVILEQVSKNTFKLNLHAYMNIYSIVNVYNLKLFENSMMIEVKIKEGRVLPSIEDLAPSTMDVLKEDFVLQNKI